MSRKNASQCPRCGADRHRGRCKKTGDVVPHGKPEPVAANTLEVPSSYGFTASAEGGVLTIKQDTPPDKDGAVFTHQIDLTLGEAQKLIAWIEAQVDKEAA
jgi:hypothetical protein